MATIKHNYINDFENILAAGNEPNMTKEYNPLVACKLEKYLNPSQLKNHVLKSEKIQQLIDYYAQKQNTTTKDIRQQVHDILNEIGLDRNMAIIRWCGIAITAIGKRICKGIYVNKASMDKVKEGLGKNPVLYLPSHRSYMDFILMSYICFHYDIEIPGIAAGMDFHSMFAMGTMLRKTGAFFMRRSFSNDELYWDVFREYMYALVAAYHIGVEFFIEGTRSRNFKALVPKIGLLSMALLPYFTGEVSDITIVPVSVSYERVLEEQLFVYELLGVPKPKESTKGFFKALKIIDERFGKMYLDFGEPISVRDFMGEACGADRMKRAAIGAHLQKLNKKEIDLVKGLATEIIYQQQRRIVITTFNLVCLFYTSQYYNNISVNLDELSRGIVLLKEMFEDLGAHVATDVNCIKPEIMETVEIHSNILHFKQARLEVTQVPASQLAQEIDLKRLKAHSLSPRTMAVAVPSLTLQLYINPCLFWLARPGYVIIAALQLEKEQSTNVSLRNEASIAIELCQRVEELDNIFKHEFIIESNREKEEFKRNLRFLENHGVIHITNGTISVNHNKLSHSILSAIAPFLCVYYQLAVTLNEMLPAADSLEEVPIKKILKIMQQRIEKILNTSKTSQLLHVHPYCLALDNLNIAIHALVQGTYLQRNRETGNLRKTSDKLNDLERLLLGYCNLMPFKQYYYCNTLTSKL
ncbi:dihydroxyacetone phosphate acyltransferase [Lucilia cuprina]|uniref:dihydroxyacetone phosphate acyltransferase n=1 Tax=Lucilia cuprina TaxID=7375 RepID=UPI001F0527CE|nr:dihydroxyacetone phosphate acyltransferase [Lucilia cuprina]XP_046803712.1 dihydroxyacetone phosphate acyltransferase [Lucilia cuprina]XP_046803713.1 dihydroxyacetone phosphate acyltransferase [Lucilia cuprina]